MVFQRGKNLMDVAGPKHIKFRNGDTRALAPADVIAPQPLLCVPICEFSDGGNKMTMQPTKKSFVLYGDQYPPIKNLSDSQLGKLLRLFFEYNNGHHSFDSKIDDPIVEMAFSFFVSVFDRDAVKYTQKCKKNQANAKKRWESKNATVCDGMRTDAKHADSDSDSDSDSDKDSYQS